MESVGVMDRVKLIKYKAQDGVHFTYILYIPHIKLYRCTFHKC